jgi:hypothetical protein
MTLVRGSGSFRVIAPCANTYIHTYIHTYILTFIMQGTATAAIAS